MEHEVEGRRVLWRHLDAAVGAVGTRRRAEREAVAALVAEAFPGRGLGLGHRADGSPYLLGKDRGELPTISISHCRAVAVLAVDPRRRAVGVDTECRDRLEQLRRVASRFLSPAQEEEAEAGRPDLVSAWTQKEALYKALGTEGVDFRSLPVAARLPATLTFDGRTFRALRLDFLPEGVEGTLVI